VRRQIWAYKVFAESTNVGGLGSKFRHLVAIHVWAWEVYGSVHERTKAEAKKGTEVEANAGFGTNVPHVLL
jgi:hypothetical protein